MDVHNAYKNLEHVKQKPWAFLSVFLSVFFLVSVFLFIIDFVPEPIIADNNPVSASNTANALFALENDPAEEPVRVVVKKIGLDTSIENPASTDINILDNALLSGAVRYPRSGLLGDNSTVYLFGHQSGLPVVKNQAFKAFNGIQNLDVGDEITVYSRTAAYTYLVTSVELVDAGVALIPLDSGGQKKLTLSTCNSFGQKSERYVVNADFVSRVEIN